MIDCGKILVVGDPDGAFARSEQVLTNGCRRCEGMLDAITIAAAGDFATIFVVMSSFKNRLGSALMSLRKVSPKTKIILLAKMFEEPIAMRLTSRTKDTGKPADDYFICPAVIGAAERQTKPNGSAENIERNDSADRAMEEKIRQLEKLAMEDDLTGIKNRRYMREFLQQIIERAKKEDMQVTLLVFDIDDFKHYNDDYGHAVGDNVLKQAAVMVRKCCRDHDVIGRIGGDEFAVVFWDCPTEAIPIKEIEPSERRAAAAEHPHEAIFIAERFRKELSSSKLSFLGAEGKGTLTISGGMASFPRDGATVEELFEQADMAMLDAKRNGKNRVYLIGEPQ